MSILGDYHTHTVFSHGRGSIEDNVKMAMLKGLKEIGITDHGFAHGSYGVRRMDLENIRAEILRLRTKYPEINIYLGMETNLMGTDGSVDIQYDDLKWMDIMICGFHKYVTISSLKNFGDLFLPNVFLTVTKFSAKQIVKNTDAYLKALDKYPIDIISHPNYGIKTDVVEIAKLAKSKGTYLELNGKKVSMTKDEIIGIAKTGVGIIIDSDAHSAERVGEFSVPLKAMVEAGLDPDCIVNMDKLPKFLRVGHGKYVQG